jgi:hypothetical protein
MIPKTSFYLSSPVAFYLLSAHSLLRYLLRSTSNSCLVLNMKGVSQLCKQQINCVFFNAVHPVVLGTVYFTDFITLNTKQSLSVPGCKIVTY